MNILDLAEELGFSPKRSSSTNGGEYKSGCPKCQEGKDRFCIWPQQGTSGRYWCRVCDAKGDAIQFCRDFLGMDFYEACQKVNIPPLSKKFSRKNRRLIFAPSVASPPAMTWQYRARSFVTFSHQQLINGPEAIEQLIKRGISIETIKQFCLGWNPQTFYDKRERWGLPQELTETGKPRCQWLPKGIVIPSFCDTNPLKIKIRRSDWHKKDTFSKYVEVSGSQQSPSVYGDISKPIVIVESELDAILIQQEASHLICSIALGGVSKKPDAELHALLKKAPLILLALDFDEAGKKRYRFWMGLYSHLRPWPAVYSKSPGDDVALTSPESLLKWVKAGLFTS